MQVRGVILETGAQVVVVGFKVCLRPLEPLLEIARVLLELHLGGLRDCRRVFHHLVHGGNLHQSLRAVSFSVVQLVHALLSLFKVGPIDAKAFLDLVPNVDDLRAVLLHVVVHALHPLLLGFALGRERADGV